MYDSRIWMCWGLSSRDTFSAGGICEQAETLCRRERAANRMKREDPHQNENQKWLLCPSSSTDFSSHTLVVKWFSSSSYFWLEMSCERESSVAFSFNLSRHFVWPIGGCGLHGGPPAVTIVSFDSFLHSLPCVCPVRRKGSYPSRTAVTGRPTHIVTTIQRAAVTSLLPSVQYLRSWRMCTRRWRHTPSSTVWCFDAVTHPVRTHTNEKNETKRIHRPTKMIGIFIILWKWNGWNRRPNHLLERQTKTLPTAWILYSSNKYRNTLPVNGELCGSSAAAVIIVQYRKWRDSGSDIDYTRRIRPSLVNDQLKPCLHIEKARIKRQNTRQ